MAKMIPSAISIFEKNSLEDIIFESFENLSEDYYVFHSMQILHKEYNGTYDTEIDFIIFHPQKGVLIIEAKAGQIRYEDGEWLYSNGQQMKYGGPFNQAKINKYRLLSYVRDKGNKFNLTSKCFFGHAVCFPSINKNNLKRFPLPPESPLDIIICWDDLHSIEEKIEKIFYWYKNENIQTNLNELETKYLINNILCPTLNLVPTVSIEYDIVQIKFNRLLEEQKNVLNFLEEQKSAVISGCAGTGKTMIALEKARRHSEKNDKVLFLCFNRALRDYLESNYRDINIDYFTIDKFAYHTSLSSTDNIRLLKQYLEDVYLNEREFIYKHIIIDEGQDFGKDFLEEQDIIRLLKLVIDKKEGTFYLFYDKMQMIQSENVPEYITEADCKLTLYKNCRNTYNIATTSMILLNNEPKLSPKAIIGSIPNLYFTTKPFNESLDLLDKIIGRHVENGINDIVILTPKANDKSALSTYKDSEYYSYKNKKFKWTTIRKFKGLEADVVILIEIDKKTIVDDKLLFYVGSSRAKMELEVIMHLTEADANELNSLLGNTIKGKNNRKAFSTYLKAFYREVQL